MYFEELDKKSEEKLREILEYFNGNEFTISGYTIKKLVEEDYLDGHDCKTLSDNEPLYFIKNITQKGKAYFEMKERYEKEQKQAKRKEWLMFFLGALLGQLSWIIPMIFGRSN